MESKFEKVQRVAQGKSVATSTSLDARSSVRLDAREYAVKIVSHFGYDTREAYDYIDRINLEVTRLLIERAAR